MKTYLSLLLLLPALFLTSCSTFAEGKTKVSIKASEPNAILRVNDEIVGQGTAELNLSNRYDYNITAEQGDRVARAIINRELSSCGRLDLIGTCIIGIPVIGLLSSGCWRLERDAVYLQLPPEKQ